jgi:hypothetical protein
VVAVLCQLLVSGVTVDDMAQLALHRLEQIGRDGIDGELFVP